MMKYAHWLLAALWACTLAALIVPVLTPYGAATTSDSLSYLDIATNITAGKGTKASDFSLSTSATRGVVEQRAWPSLYPAALSLVIQHPADVEAIAQLSMLLFSISMTVVFLLLAPSMQWGAALLIATMFGLTSPILTIYTFTWSETLFVPLLLLAIWSAARYVALVQIGQTQRFLMLVVLSITLCMLAYTRYIGIVFSLLLPLVFLMNRRDSTDRRLLVVTGLFYSLVVGHLLYSNLATTGHLSGVQRSPSNGGILEVLNSLQQVLAILIPDEPIVLTITLIAAALLALLRYHREPSPAENIHARRLTLILGVSGIVYLAALTALRSQYRFDDIDVRLLAPAFVAFFCLAAVAPSAIAAKRKAVIVQLFGGLIIAMPALQGYSRLEVVPENWRAQHKPGHRSSINGTYNNFTRDTANDSRRQLLAELMQPGGVLVIDRPVVWEFISGFRSMQKPAAYDTQTLQILNALPPGSLLVMQKREVRQFKTAVRIPFRYFNLGPSVAIPLPVTDLSHHRTDPS